MSSPFTSAGFKPDVAFAQAAERFFELLKTFGLPAAGGAGNWSALAAPLASQFEQWLRASQSAGPWFAATGGAAPSPAGAPSGSAAASSPFGPLPLGPAAAQTADAARSWELLGKLAQLQTQLGAHWGEIANTAARSFIARLGGAAGVPTTPEQALKLYELWVNCAEEAYSATVHKEEFGRLQAELANTSAALLVEQRRHAETLVRAFGLPTRSEVDALYAQVKDLRRQLAELAPRAPPNRTEHTAAGAARAAAARSTTAAADPRAAARRHAKQGAPRPSRKRARPRRPRA